MELTTLPNPHLNTLNQSVNYIRSNLIKKRKTYFWQNLRVVVSIQSKQIEAYCHKNEIPNDFSFKNFGIQYFNVFGLCMKYMKKLK